MAPAAAGADTVVIDGCAIATVDATGTEHSTGHVVVTRGRIAEVGAGPAPPVDGARRVDATGCLETPGFVNTHHHLYQWLTRGYAPDGTLFEWLTALYPVWAHLDADLEFVAASAGLAALALSGCTTAMDHHLFARARLGPQALSARQALWMATIGGARCLGRSDALGSLEVGKLGDLALWRLDGLGHADIADPVCALVFGPPAPLELLLVGGHTVVDAGELCTADAAQVAAANRAGARELATRAGLR
jgi:cytosine/adenosine deaminase-related metal-dependent hydrolase